MMTLNQLAEALAGLITQRTGVATHTQRLHTAVYPMYALQAVPEETRLAAGGDQLWRRVAVTVACHGSRQRQTEEGLELADKLAKALTPGLPLGTRHLTPLRLECRVRESRPEVRFWLEFYDTADAGDEA